MAQHIVERYQSRPYGFTFSTRARTDDELDSKTIATSTMYFLGGTIESLEQVKRRNDPNDSTLIRNMENNGIARIIRGDSPWRWCQPFNKGDKRLKFEHTE